MTTAERFEDLEAWQKAKELTSLIYRLSSTGTFARDFGLRDQMQRAAVSIMSNIAGFQSASSTAEQCSRQPARFIRYLESQPNARRVREDGVHYDIRP